MDKLKLQELITLKNERDVAEEALQKIQNKLSENCWHPKRYVEEHSRGYPGGYDYEGHTDKWKICNCCSRIFDREVIHWRF